MHFNNHWQLQGKHAFLGASKYHWIRYDIKKMETVFKNHYAAKLGDDLHALAAEMIRLKVKVGRNQAIGKFVNDAIGFRMTPEQVLYFSDNCFGTADAISFDKRLLRIHDLKTGVHPGNMDQLLIYAAMFCLEYQVKPATIEIVLRIYQGLEIIEYIPDPEEVKTVMDTIVTFDAKIDELKGLME